MIQKNNTGPYLPRTGLIYGRCVCAQNAAALLLYPIVVDLSSTTEGLDRRQAVLVLMVASSASFLTPISFQTNLMGALRLPDTIA